MSESVIAFIPARAGSKGLPGKNTIRLDGKPLYRHAIDHAHGAGIVDVVISTDIEEILHDPAIQNVRIVRRRPELADDDAEMAAVLLEHLQNDPSDGIVVLLQATSPLRTSGQVRDALAHLIDGVDLVMSVVETDRSVLKCGMVESGRFVPLRAPRDPFTNRQHLPRIVRPNGAIFVFRADWFVRNGGFETRRIAAYEMDEQSSVDIDTEEDLERAARILAQRGTR